MMRPRRSIAALALAALASAAGCESQETVTRYRPFFTGIGGAEFGTDPINPNSGYVDPTSVPETKLVVEHDDGSKTYTARSPSHVIAHVNKLLEENSQLGDEEMLAQLISEKTKQHYREQGKDPQEFINDLRAARKDVAKFFSRMPLGEHSPTIIIDRPGDNTWILRLTGAAAKDLKFTRAWFRLERSQWKLMWLSQ